MYCLPLWLYQFTFPPKVYKGSLFFTWMFCIGPNIKDHLVWMKYAHGSFWPDQILRTFWPGPNVFPWTFWSGPNVLPGDLHKISIFLESPSTSACSSFPFSLYEQVGIGQALHFPESVAPTRYYSLHGDFCSIMDVQFVVNQRGEKEITHATITVLLLFRVITCLNPTCLIPGSCFLYQ